VIEVVVGEVVKPHGVRGDVVIEPHTDEAGVRFAAGAVLTAAGRRLTVKTCRAQGGRLVVGFAGISTRNDAESMTGTMLTAEVPETERPAGADEFYDRHLVGLEVRLADGSVVGCVTEVMHGPAQDILAIDTPAGERLVPFVSELVPVVDLDAGVVTVAAIPGLLSETD